MLEIEDKGRRVGIYGRVDAPDQSGKGESLDKQTSCATEFAEARGWEIVRIYRDEGFSATDVNRPEYKRMMEDIKNGLINTVMVSNIDRLSRSILDFENVYKEFEASGVDLVSTQNNFDTGSPEGRATMRVILGLAQFEREQISERTKDVLGYRAKSGEHNGGVPPIGFDIDYTTKTLIPNMVEILTAQEMFSIFRETGSLLKAVRSLNDRGYRTKGWTSQITGKVFLPREFTKQHLLRLLRNPVYIGKTRFKKNIYDGKHEGIIDPGLFEVVQNMLDKNSKKRTKS